MKKVLLAVFFLLLSYSSYASHAMGADITYECLGGNQYRVTLQFYRDCSGISAPTNPTLQIWNGCTNTSTSVQLTAIPLMSGVQVSSLCPSQLPCSSCNNPNPPTCSIIYPGVQLYTYTAIVTLPSACANWEFRFSESARNPSNNINGGNLYVAATVNNTIDPQTGQTYCNNAPTFQQLPVPFVCLNSLETFNNSTIEPDGDSITYQLIQPLSGPGSNVGFVAPFTLANPLPSTPPLTIGGATGQMTYKITQTGSYTVAVRVNEYRNGVLVGSVIRDIQITVIQCNKSIPQIQNITNVQNGTQIDSTTVQTCPGTALQFNIFVRDPNGRNLDSVISPGLSTILPGAVLTKTVIGTGPKDSVLATITWTPAPSDTGCHNFVLNATNDDCPVKGTTPKVFKICVLTKVTVTPDTAVFCGDSIQLKATGGSNFSWTPTLGLSGANTLTPKAGPAVNTTYIFTSDCGTDSAYIIANPPFTLDAGLGDSICQGGQVQLNATVDNIYAPYTIKWVPSTGLVDPILGLPNDTIFNPVAEPLQTTTYIAYITGNNNCVRKDSLKVVIKGIGQPIRAKAAPTSICPGAQTQLIVVGNPAACGKALDTACLGNKINKQVGIGTGNQPGTQSTYPSQYGTYSKSARHQYLIKASELLALYGSGGKITSIAFNIGVPGAYTPLPSFTIKLGCTQKDSLTGYEPNLTTVYGPKTYTAATGWNTHKFDFAYDWDGTTNLIVDVCFNQTAASLGTNPKLQISPTSYRSVWFTNDNGSDQCGATGTHTGVYAYYFNRPNMKFDMCVANLDSNIVWSPTFTANAPVNPFNDTTLAFPNYPQTYSVSYLKNGCNSSDFVTIFVDTSTRLNVTPDTFICSINPVQLHANITGSQANPNALTYTWTSNNAASPAPASGLGTAFAHPTVNPTSPTVYTCVVSGGACTLRDTVAVVIGNGLPVNIAYYDTIKCFGNKGELKNATLGGIAPFTYSWTGTATGNTDSLTNVGPGTYFLFVSDVQGCNGRDTITITQPTQLVATLDSTNVTCFNANNGTLTATVSGGTPSYSYTWNPANTNTGSLSSLSPGLYQLTVKDANNCQVVLARNITQPTQLTSSMTTTNVSGAGNSDGGAHVFPSGGKAPYTYDWIVGGGTLDSIINKTAGTYIVKICDANNCCIFDTAIITVPPPIILTPSIVHVKCFGSNTGFATVAASGGVLPYSYQWSANAANSTNDSIFNLVAGTYFLTVTDSNGISVTTNVVITQPTKMTATFDSTSITCFGLSNGKLKINVTGGTPNYTYNWAPIAGSTDSLINLPTGKYYVTVTDANGCVYKDSVSLGQPTLLQASLVSTDSVSCFNGNDGKATITQTGGTPNYSYAWSSIGGNTATVNTFIAGSYIATVTDTKGCSDTVHFSIGQPLKLSAVFDSTSIICNGGNNGKLKIIVSGGVKNYSYNWSAGTPNNRDSITNLFAGKYIVTVTDAKGCTYIDSASLAQPLAVLATVINIDSVSCFGGNDGKATAQVTIGTPTYTYAWSGTASTTATVNNLSVGNQFVTVTDFKGCKDTVQFVIGQPTKLAASFDSTSITCFGYANGKLKINVTGGTPSYSYNWAPIAGNTDSLVSIPTGKYFVTVTDANGCIYKDSASLGQPTQLVASLVSTDSVSCYGGNNGKATITQTGGTPNYSYIWSSIGGNTSTVTTFVAGNYAATVTDSKGCTDSLSFTIYQPAAISRNVSTVNSHCIESTDGSATVIVNGGFVPYTYTWDNVVGTTTKTGLATGQHILVTTDGRGCSAADTFVINANYVLAVTSKDDSTLCYNSTDGRITITPQNGFPLYHYTWSNGAPDLNVAGSLAAGIYSVVVKDLYNCTAFISDTVYQPAQIGLQLSKTDPLCFGNANGTATVAVTDPYAPFRFLWSNGDTTATANSLIAGSYTVTVTNAKNCQNIGSITLVDPVELVATGQKQEITCANALDGSITVSTTGGTTPYVYNWSDIGVGTAIRNGLAPGTYSVVVVDKNGCNDSLSFTFLAPPILAIDSILVDSVGCPGYSDGSLLVFASGGTPSYFYSLDSVNFVSTNSFAGLPKGSYTIYIKDNNNCATSATTQIYEPAQLVLNILPQDSTIELGKTIRLYSITTPYPSTAISNYQWLPADGLNCADCQAPYASPYDDITYSLTVTYLRGCTVTETVTVNVKDGPDFYIPNAFSPNGDGNNDEFMIYGSGIKNVGMKVFNRWGEKMFDGNNEWNGWDGRFKGALQPPGVYTYHVIVEYLNGKKKEKKGSISLIR